MIDTHFSPYDGLLNYTHDFYNGKTKHTLDCWLEFEEGDASVGVKESWSVFYAYLGGVDISELLSEDTTTEIIEQAQLTYASYNETEDY